MFKYLVMIARTKLTDRRVRKGQARIDHIVTEYDKKNRQFIEQMIKTAQMNVN